MAGGYFASGQTARTGTTKPPTFRCGANSVRLNNPRIHALDRLSSSTIGFMGAAIHLGVPDGAGFQRDIVAVRFLF
ncbi:hypothetical protein G3T14_07130 [Methylobacterium sp. BTF04]|uniref:hypothetical protein n=1 Tax=Methylobacterium sp. BTF04 TaxID=2708300 RepID=UPI0013D1133E|nr:hypothetical protein [Methylobacterium sp. BTF04]NEU11901.1 hypothetical protein [Methylobacterium sp. BTF04]